MERLRSAWDVASAADQVAVILLDDEMLLQQTTSWPPSFALWQRLLERTFDQQPAAVFIDVVMGAERGDEEATRALADVIRGSGPHAYRHHAPVVLGDFPQVATLRPERTAILDPLLQAAYARAAVDWNRGGDARAYPLMATAYPPRDAGRGGTVVLPTPAPVLARLACERRGDTGPACEGILRWGALPPAQPSLLPRWPIAIDPDVAGIRRLPAARYCEVYTRGSPWLRSWRMAGILGAELLHGIRGSLLHHAPWLVPQTWYINRPPPEDEENWEGESPGLPCFPYPIVRAAALLADGTENDADLKALLEGRVVLIGDGTFGSHDTISSPIHGNVPGVLLHAAALETLLGQGADYNRTQPKWHFAIFEFERGKGLDWLLKCITILLAIFLAFRKRDAFAHVTGLDVDMSGLRGTVSRFLLNLAGGERRWRSEVAKKRAAAQAAHQRVESGGGDKGRDEPKDAVEAFDSTLKKLEKNLRWICRILVVLLLLIAICVPWALGFTASNPLLVILIALGIAVPLLQVTPLYDASPDEQMVLGEAEAMRRTSATNDHETKGDE